MTITRTFRFLLFSSLISLFSVATQAKEELLFSIHGSNTVGAKLGPSLAESYLKYLGAESVGVFPTGRENEVKVTGFLPSKGQLVSIFIAAHGSSSGFKALANGEGQIAAASRPIKSKEQAMLSDMGDFSTRQAEYVVGIDGLAIVVNPRNAVNQLDITDVARLFSGEVTNWKELGGADLPVSLFARDDRSGTWDTFKNLVLAKKYKLASAAERFESNPVLSDRVASTPGGIGFWDAVCDFSPEGVVKTLRYAIDLLGEDHVVLGSDFDGSVTTAMDASELVILTETMMKQNFTESEIRKVMGENTRRFLLEQLPEA
ncbi:MAG: substrate-binding domain-containing protein [Endozoicomonas sp.]|uniref:substrate-binding domain-containing protein n=1 Tax=Endozoicomonas sp. TaxID=1892382 RepID=UPI003D9BF2F0